MLGALFSRQVELTPDAVAVFHPDAREQLTYAELDRVADGVARVLTERGVGPGSFVGVCLPQGCRRIAAFLSVWKAGAAYVSMEPGHPADRHRFCVEDSGASCVITDAALAERFPPELVLPEFGMSPAEAGAPVEPPSVAPDSPAIVYYTSGTTGTPKGVLLGHASLAHFLAHLSGSGPDLPLAPGDRTAQITSPAFDATTFEVWATLTSGATLVILQRDLLTDGGLFGEEVRRHGISAMLVATSVFHEIALQNPQAFAPLRVLFVGGEAMDPRRARDVLATLSGTLVNAYGPTETTTFVTRHVVTDVTDETRTIPIGTPLPGLEAHVLDEWLRPVPEGERGELCMSGPCLSLGYLNRPEQTARAFVPHPERPDVTLYRTGDLVARGADGVLVYLGRADDQVKVRGHRIELGEIEARLLDHPDVANASVLVRGEETDRGLAGFVVPVPSAAAGTADRVRDALARELPEWMVPRLTVVDRLPLTPMGKVDRAALAALEPQREPEPVAAAPADGLSPLEQALSVMWRELLEADTVGPEDNFFSMGGHSILLGRLSARIRRDLEIRPPLRAFYSHATLGEQARMLESHGPDPARVAALVAGPGRKSGV
ncbi:non-ribosomal peptide synthetase [Streptomyces albidoflavus]|uniref:non-ribosomal peptide synthetase n=1 Tax=Streptomyces albidoflavus TaxID=1886 RepID=UPI00308B01EA|nr:non-ribosomal peptide synthetase [Streptomyces albidoflavus]